MALTREHEDDALASVVMAISREDRLSGQHGGAMTGPEVLHFYGRIYHWLKERVEDECRLLRGTDFYECSGCKEALRGD